MQKTEWLYGIHAVNSVLSQAPERVLKIVIADQRADKGLENILSQANAQHIFIEQRNRKALDKLSGDALHQGVMAECRVKKTLDEQDLVTLLQNLAEPAFLLILDSVQDPHNLGACLRSADAAGVHAVIVPRDKSAGLTGAVQKVACGAAETVPLIQVTNLARTLRALKEQNIWIYGLDDAAPQNFYQADLTGPLALVLGAEGIGLRQLTRETCDALYAIPMAGSVSSLNVSVAAGVCLFEAVRQRAR